MLGETEQLRGDQTLPSPFIIGPLGPYTVIELLSQPIFFFGTKADLDFGRSHYPKAQHLDDSVRDTNGDADEDIIEVVWQPLDASLYLIQLPSQSPRIWAKASVLKIATMSTGQMTLESQFKTRATISNDACGCLSVTTTKSSSLES